MKVEQFHLLKIRKVVQLISLASVRNLNMETCFEIRKRKESTFIPFLSFYCSILCTVYGSVIYRLVCELSTMSEAAYNHCLLIRNNSYREAAN